MYTAEDGGRAIELVGDRFPTGELVTATFPLEEASQALEFAAAGDQRQGIIDHNKSQPMSSFDKRKALVVTNS